MSQEKVDKYKQEKANRKKAMAKEKLKKRLYILAGVLITAAFITWIGWSVVVEQKAKKEQEALISSLQEELNAMAATANATTTGTGAGSTTGTGDTTTSADKTTSADDKSSSEATTEEQTTTSADEKKE